MSINVDVRRAALAPALALRRAAAAGSAAVAQARAKHLAQLLVRRRLLRQHRHGVLEQRDGVLLAARRQQLLHNEPALRRVARCPERPAD